MKTLIKRMVQFGIVGGFLLTPSLQAEDLDSTKKASSDGLFSNAYSSVLLRNRQERDAGESFKNTWEARYTLGSTFFSDFMTAQITFRAANSGNTATVVDKGTFIETSYDVYSGDYAYFNPLLEIYFPGTGASNITAALGSNQGVKYKGGDFSIGLHHYFYVLLGTKHNQVELLNNGEVMTNRSAIPKKLGEKYNLSNDNDAKILMVDQRSATLMQLAVLATKWKPSFLKGFSIGLNGYMEQYYTPQMEYVNETKKIAVVRTKFLGTPNYILSNEFYGRFRLAYDFTKKTNLDFDTYFHDSGKVELRSSLTVKLF